MSTQRLFISTGEVSSERHAAHLLGELRSRNPGLTVDAFAGKHLQEAGARLLFPLTDYAVMGFAAVFAQVGAFVRALKLFGRYLDEERPDAVVLLDYPGLHVRMAALAKRRGIPVIYYICPQLWAWAPWRARRFTRVVDHALTILPFEEEYFRRRGIDARFVGHPSADVVGTESAVLPAHVSPIRDGETVLAIMPGSRPQEVRSILPLMLDTIDRLRSGVPDARFLLPQLRGDTAEVCRDILKQRGATDVELVDAVEPVLRVARFAMVASGTATFEVARHRVPMVVVYCIKRIHELLGGLMITVPWISQVNLIAGRRLVPEFLVHRVTPEVLESLSAACLERIRDTPVRTECLAAFENDLAPAFAPGASGRAADEILRILSR